MRIIKPEELATARLGANEAFFVELLYSMTHQKSLDSYRVRCMNSRMLIRELAEELAIGLIKPCDLIGVSTETKLSLSTDPVISTYFSSHLNIISTFWDNPPQAERDNKKRDLEKEKEFLFITNDFSSALEKSYWKYCCAILPGTINSGDKERIKTVLSNTIADLVDRGWPIETVFSWHDHFLAPKNIKAYGFDKNLSFMLKMFSKKEQQFEVTLRLTGSDNLSKLGGFGDFTFSPLPDNLGEGAPKKFRTATNLVCFAQANVDDSDF